MKLECAKTLEETEQAYQEGRHHFGLRLERSAAADALWIWRAQIVIEAMGLYRGMSPDRCAELRRVYSWTFDPQDFCEYSWMCLRGEQGVRVREMYGEAPPSPPLGLSTQEQKDWLYTTAHESQDSIVAHWHGGKTLLTSGDRLILRSLSSRGG